MHSIAIVELGRCIRVGSTGSFDLRCRLWPFGYMRCFCWHAGKCIKTVLGE